MSSRGHTELEPTLVEIGAGYAPTHRFKFTGAVGVVPGGEQAHKIGSLTAGTRCGPKHHRDR